MRQKWLQKPPLGTSINCSHPSAKGRVGDWIFNEGGGDLVNDLSGNANHGTLKNMAFPPTTASGWNPGRAGVGLKFDGANDYVDCGSHSSLDLINAITIEAWLKPKGVSDAHAMIIDKMEWGKGYEFYTGNTGARVSMVLSDGINFIYGPVYDWSNDYGKWHHIIGRWDGTDIRLFVNGADIGNPTSFTGSMGITANHLKFGVNYGGSNFFNGTIDEVRIYNRALSAEEVLDSYVNPFGRFERTKWGLLVPTAPPIGLSIPVAMHNYRRLRA